MTKYITRFVLLVLALSLDSRVLAQTYFHDAVGRLTQVSYPDGQGIRYDYDEGDNLISVQPLALPDAPSNLSVNRLSGTTVELAWSDNSTNETGFVILRRAIGDSIWTQIAIVAPNGQQYTDDTAISGLDYAYRVAAQGTEGLSAYSSIQSTAAATFAISSVSLRNTTQGRRMELTFPTEPGSVYHIEAASNLAAPDWQSSTFSTSRDGTADAQMTVGTGSPQSVFLDLTASSMFYRLRRD